MRSLRDPIAVRRTLPVPISVVWMKCAMSFTLLGYSFSLSSHLAGPVVAAAMRSGTSARWGGPPSGTDNW
ncbi:uncharacterized protein N7518_000524 [Penicillium psychrosexuale]|uniref:uncharacterized protein n=1 Tax=Penicillium psychrosexuale TaxID=1002107 RepID=UPI0025458B60|nr:uncharacterized protein N7518_000524 [Penicillium psychrosexuale]KAJ5804221.1 hypothetical protein N7518_000524 [Penicillium psychrosexuale]